MSSTKQKEQACIENLKKYIASFNAGDLQGCKECLAEHVQVFVEGTLAATGRDTILPSYSSDFKAGKQVIIAREPVVDKAESNNQVAIHVGLEAISEESTVSMDVVYTYDTQAMNQVRHDICNIVTQEKLAVARWRKYNVERRLGYNVI